jgi:hypothetical protein
MAYPPCAIGSNDNSSLSLSVVSSPLRVPISRPETMISAFGRGSADSVSKRSCLIPPYTGCDASCIIAARTVVGEAGRSS